MHAVPRCQTAASQRSSGGSVEPACCVPPSLNLGSFTWEFASLLTFTKRRKMKGRAPPPPISPAVINTEKDGKCALAPVGRAAQQSLIEMKENVLHRKVEVTIVLPGGIEKKTTVQGSKAVMDQLVDLCSQCHLNPVYHTLELKSKGSQQPLNYKPNTLIGTLDIDTIILKEKVLEGKTKRPPPKIPTVTVRLVVNFQRTQKTVVRVSPLVPLRDILPVICEKCEFRQEEIVLLRDEASREELPLSKTLNELGIKELYAWNRQRGTSRISSVSSDSLEKEKKGLLRFLRIKKNKMEEHVMEMDNDQGDDEIFKAAADDRNIQETSTAPNSPAFNSRTIALGPSLSLNNILEITRPEMKKRRAPPPPVATFHMLDTQSSAEEEVTVQIVQTSQNELQKKKRRAPAPPTPVVPNQVEEKEEKRKSDMGNGRQVPQKPPRGNTRAPPLLVIPPPPPYPPPDVDDMDPLVFQNEADIMEPAKLLLNCNSVCPDVSMAMESSDGAETTSTNMWLMSEDITEDSGVVSSPSDTISLDLQNDCVKPKLSWDYEDSVDADVTYIAQLCPVQTISSNSDDLWTNHQSRDDELMVVKNGDEDMFITAQFQQTLAELHEESGDEASFDCKTQSYSEPSQMAEISSPYEYDAESDDDIAVAVPVTIIDVVYDTHSCSPTGDTEDESTEGDNREESTRNLEKFTNTNNNNVGISREVSVDYTSLLTDGNLTYESTEPKPTSRSLNQSKDALELYSFLPTNKKDSKAVTSCPSYDNGFDLVEEKFQATFIAEAKMEQAGTACISRPEDKQKSQSKTDSETRHISRENDVPLRTELTSPTSWLPHVHNPLPSYEPKVGLTTFKVVPPKPGIKQYDRGVSISASAIKIDELGNLISPYTSIKKKDPLDTIEDSESEGSLVRRAKEFWRSTSMDKQTEDTTEQGTKNSVATISSKPQNKEIEIKSDFLPHRKSVPFHTNTCQASERHSEYKESNPPLLVTLPEVKPYTIPGINNNRGDLSFLKPYRRTSSQYIASAISKYTNPTESQPNIEICSKEDTTYKDRPLKSDLEPKNKKCIIISKYTVVDKQQDKTSGSYQNFNNYRDREWNTLSFNSHNGKESNGNVESSDETNLVGTSEMNVNGYISNLSSRETNRIEDYRLNGGQNVANKQLNTAKKCEVAVDVSSSQSSLESPVQYKSSMPPCFVSNSANYYPTHKESTLSKSSPLFHQVVSERENKPDVLPASTKMEPDIISNSSIFGPKKKFRPVVQKPVQKDTSLHEALMESIQSGDGKEKLRKIQKPESMSDGSQKKLSFVEAETERSALLSAIRAHGGSSKLRKISSSVSEELESVRTFESLLQGSEKTQLKQFPMLLPPSPPPPPPPSPSIASVKACKYSMTPRSDPVNAREALMDAIRSGTGAASLKKVSVSMSTI
uniref:Protein cordon-bleu isoform X3 n=1 Tax=Geotrypetes seraphini TaxID=260995 RepID=A0A6P8PBD2_GEOSA|nr:protein cordon-bleu isoform X3 [Geotrypetes seraphini]